MLHFARGAQRVRRQRHRRLGIEHLEERCLLSGSAPAIPYGPLPAVVAGLTQQQVDRADAVINWNATMLRAIWNDATPPTWTSRVEAMVGVAVYDAVDGVDPDAAFYPVPGLTTGPPRDASQEAAAIAAADTVLNALYPDQQGMFSAEYQATLAQVPDGYRKEAGLAWGQTVAQAVLAWRSQDGSNAPSNYQPAPPGGPPGVYELTPPGYVAALTPQWGQVTPWAIPSAQQFLPPPPPALDSAEYAADFNQTESLGGTTSTTRTEDQTLYAHFWADVPGHSVTPPGHWDEIAEHMALQDNLSLEANARLFALLNMGLADAGIVCWDTKYIYNFWRPVTAIQDPRASAINSATTSDPTWTPLWNTPDFPSYDSGHSSFSGAASVILASIFGPDTPFTIGSDDMPGYTRSFTSFAQAADEAGFSRVVGGIHFEFDNLAGLSSGRAIGEYIVHNLLLPQGGRCHEHEGGHGHSGERFRDAFAGPGNADGFRHLVNPGPGTDAADGWLLAEVLAGLRTAGPSTTSMATSAVPRQDRGQGQVPSFLVTADIRTDGSGFAAGEAHAHKAASDANANPDGFAALSRDLLGVS